MTEKSRRVLLCGALIAWSVAAFFISVKPISEVFAFRLAFRNMYIPVFYWAWAAAGASLILAMSGERAPGVIRFLTSALFLNLMALMSRLICDDRVHNYISGPYLLYIYAMVLMITSAGSAWGMFLMFRVRSSMSGISFLAAPIMCLTYSVYKNSLMPIIVFTMAIVIILAITLLRDPAGRLWGKSKSLLARFIGNGRKVAVLIFIIAFVIRLAFALILISKTGERYLFASDDGTTYHYIAEEIASSPHAMVATLADKPWPPVYLTFLGMLYMIFDKSLYVVVVIQSALGALVPLAVYLIGRRVFDRDTGIVAGLLASLSQPLIFVSSVLGTEALYVPLIVCAVYLLIEGVKRARNSLLVLSGVALSVAAMTIGSVVLLPFALAVYLILAEGDAEKKRRRISSLLVFFAAFLSVYLIMKIPLVMSSGAARSRYEDEGAKLWHTASSFSYDKDPDNRRFIALGIDPVARPIESVKIAFAERGKVAKIALDIFPTRIQNFFLWNNFGFFDPLLFVNSGKISNSYASTLEFYALVIFIIGILSSVRGCAGSGALAFFLLIGYYVTLYPMMFVAHTNRYSCPVKPFLILFLAYGIVLGYKKIRKALAVA